MTAKAIFYIEYRDGRQVQIQFKTAAGAAKACELFEQEKGDDVYLFGWRKLFQRKRKVQPAR